MHIWDSGDERALADRFGMLDDFPEDPLILPHHRTLSDQVEPFLMAGFVKAFPLHHDVSRIATLLHDRRIPKQENILSRC